MNIHYISLSIGVSFILSLYYLYGGNTPTPAPQKTPVANRLQPVIHSNEKHKPAIKIDTLESSLNPPMSGEVVLTRKIAKQPSTPAISSIDGLIDDNKIQYATRAISTGTEDERIESISILAKIGTPEQKAIIRDLALDQNQPIAVRLTSVENLDWNHEVNTISDLIKDNPQEAEAIMYMAAAKDIEPQARERLDTVIYESFSPEASPSSQLAALNYFLEQKPSI